MEPLFAPAKRRVTAAARNIERLKIDLDAILADISYCRRIEVDPASGNRTHKVVLAEPFPDAVLDMADSIVEALRAALDGAGFASAKATGNRRLKATYFPIADTEEGLESGVIGRKRCADIPASVLDIFRSFKPYRTGNPMLWGLNQLANGTKHRSLVPIGLELGGVFRGSYKNAGKTIYIAQPPAWDAERGEAILCIVGPSEMDVPTYEMRFSIVARLGNLEYNLNIHPTSLLRRMAEEVEEVLHRTEYETLRILRGA